MDKLYLLYEGRVLTGRPTEKCAVLTTAGTPEEALAESKRLEGVSSRWYEYDVTDEGELINEVPRPDLHTPVA